MKASKGKELKKLLVIGVLCVTILGFSACGSDELKGTYKSGGIVSQTFTFDGDNITMSAFGINASGTYKIDGENIEITYSLFGQECTFTQSFSKDGNSIYIGGTEFKKQ